MKTRNMGNFLQVALEVKQYVANQGRTLAISQGKMLKDPNPQLQVVYDKQTA